MRLLVTTQKIDQADSTLGFFCRWIEEFAKHFEKITVICLEKGDYTPPNNVEVYSLGKENFQSGLNFKFLNLKFSLLRKLLYVIKFKLYIFRISKKYDAVFVHMNPEYLLIGGLFWRLFGKPAALWYNHPAWNWRVRLAVKFADKVFYTSPQASTARLSKSVQMPVGIDTEQFKKSAVIAGSNTAMTRKILSLGRISKYKRIHVMLEALKILHDEGADFKFNIFGNKVLEEDQYFDDMRARMNPLEQIGKIAYAPGVPPKDPCLSYMPIWTGCLTPL